MEKKVKLSEIDDNIIKVKISNVSKFWSKHYFAITLKYMEVL